MDKDRISLKRSVSNAIYAFKLMIKLFPTYFFFQTIFSVCESVSSFLLYTYLVRLIVNGIQFGVGLKSLIHSIVLISLLVITVGLLNKVYSTLFAPRIKKQSYSKLYESVYKKSVSLDLSDFDNPDYYDLFNRAIDNGTKAVLESIDYLNNVLRTVIGLFLTSWLYISIDPILIIFALFPLILNIIDIKANELWYRCEIKEGTINRKIDYVKRTFYMPDYAKEMRVSPIGNVMFRYYFDAVKDFCGLIKKEGIKQAAITFCINFGVQGVSVLGAELYSILKTTVSHSMMYGDCLVVLNSMANISWGVLNFGQIFTDAHEIALHVQDYRCFWERRAKITSKDSKKLATNGDIIFENVSFQYEGSDNCSLSNINMHIKKGTKVAIVGANGSGKSTLVKLLLRLYEPIEGNIYLNDTIISDLNVESYRSKYSIVFQDYHQACVSIADNVLGKPYTEKDRIIVESALDKVGLRDVIELLPQGIHTVIGKEFDDNGAVFSQGQLQKLAIATAYARGGEILIVDEPTSALDPLSEQKLFEDMSCEFKDKTVILISHRLTSVVNADQIIVLDGSKVVEAGSHKDLIRKQGIYSKMFNIQAKKYLEDREDKENDEG